MLDLERKATCLLKIAQEWNGLVEALTCGPDWMDDREAQAALLAMTYPFIHDSIRDNCLDLLNDLVVASTNHDRYMNRDGGLPEHIAEKYELSIEECQAALQQDVDDALFPLLTGRTTADVCVECRRVRSQVWMWRVATDMRRCDMHPLPMVGAA